ncbi:hypothetical protein [Shewanella maritima]
MLASEGHNTKISCDNGI